MAEPVVMSGSSLNTYLRCPHQWELAYVRAIKRPPSLKMALGIAAHAAAELDMAQKVQTRQDLPLADVLDAFRDSFVAETVNSREYPLKKETRPRLLDSGVAAVTKWHVDVAPPIQPLYVEEPIQFAVNGIPYTGTMDVVDEQTRVRDWKFVGRKPSSGGDYTFNMTGYAVGYRHRHPGQVEAGVVLDYVVRTVTPQYVSFASDGPVPNQAIAAFARRVGSAHRKIQEGSFPPTGLRTNACSYCPYNEGTCKPYRDAQRHQTR